MEKIYNFLLTRHLILTGKIHRNKNKFLTENYKGVMMTSFFHSIVLRHSLKHNHRGYNFVICNVRSRYTYYFELFIEIRLSRGRFTGKKINSIE